MEIIPLTPADLIQANVTIIAGIMILLTISIVTQKQTFSHFWGDPLGYIAFSPVMFIISVGLLVHASIYQSQFWFQAGVVSFIVALAYLMISIIIISWTIAKNKI